jgi:hypothetical protein
VSCVCGLVIREGTDLITLDMCGGEPGEALPQLALTSLTSSALRTRILEARGGKILMVSYLWQSRLTGLHSSYAFLRPRHPKSCILDARGSKILTVSQM